MERHLPHLDLVTIRDRATTAGRLLARIQPAAVRRLSLENYLERTALAVTSADAIYLALKQCFS